MRQLPKLDSERNAAPRLQRLRTCLTCGKRLERKRCGRPAQYCSPRCRDRAYEGRNFAVSATARIRKTCGLQSDQAIRRNGKKTPANSVACEGDFAGRGSAFSVPLDLVGNASHRFDSAPRLDPAVRRAILKSELPTAITALERIHERHHDARPSPNPGLGARRQLRS